MKRFYTQVDITERDNGFAVTLDGRVIKTQGGGEQIVPTRKLAELLHGEWAEQGETLDPKRFAMRDMADYAIDHVAAAREDVIAKLLTYGETDTLCYRAEPGEPLFARQQDEWEPVLTAFEARHGIAFNRVSGIIHHAQPDESLSKLRSVLEAHDHFALAALQTMASLAASLCIGLEAIADGAEVSTLWDASVLEERWQIEQWGEDAEAKARADKRRAEFMAAHRFFTALSG